MFGKKKLNLNKKYKCILMLFKEKVKKMRKFG